MPARRHATSPAAAWALLLAHARFALAVDFAKQERSEYEVELLAKTLQQVLDEGNFTTVNKTPLEKLAHHAATFAVAGVDDSATCPDYWSNWTAHVSCMLDKLTSEDVCPHSKTGWVICAFESFFNIILSNLILCQSTFWCALFLLTLMNVMSHADELARLLKPDQNIQENTQRESAQKPTTALTQAQQLAQTSQSDDRPRRMTDQNPQQKSEHVLKQNSQLPTLMHTLAHTDDLTHPSRPGDKPLLVRELTTVSQKYQERVVPWLPFYKESILPWRALVSGVVILNIFQADWTGASEHIVGRFVANNPVWSSIIFILFEKTISSWTTIFLVKRLQEAQEAENTKWKSEKLSNRYQELTYSLCKLVCLFFVQDCLLMFYVLNLHESSELTDQGAVSCFKWLIGVGVVVVAGDDEMGQRFNIPFWISLHRETSALHRETSEEETRKKHPWLNIEIKLRAFMSFVVNSAGLTFLRRTFPVILAVSGPWDFIMDCMAIFFIVKLDDHDGNRTVDKELWKKLNPERNEDEYTELEDHEYTEVGQADKP